MLNQVVLVGRLVREFTINTTDSKKKIATMTLAIPRSFKNIEGIYETDFVDCTLFEGTALNTKEYCKKGDILGVKGRVQSRIIEKEDKKITELEIIAEKVTFLSSKTKDEQ